MKSVLYVEASPRKSRSASIEVARAFTDTLMATAPGLRIDVLDVWNTPLPEFDGAVLQAKYAGLEGRERTDDEIAAWRRISALGDRFKAADLLLFGIPAWNWSIPYKLKHLIDVVSQKDVLFTFDERGLNGLLTDRRALCIYARGVDYGSGSSFEGWDHQKPYMETWLRSIGVTMVDTIIVEKTLMGPDADGRSREAACEQARGLARRLANWERAG
ncbi:MAG: FMN-dependent NADH-azoreductase [Panacagrimonas sp.]|nr:NAD(P)H-dependent oxidoreductase [Panacagrimonas sp.]MCC2656948.1 FMN-dependent NADH-azoreductase [Panacagrimonas sp.]